MRWAVGPLTSVRVGAVFGFVLGVAVPIAWMQIRHGAVGNIFPMAAIFAGGPLGAIAGAAVGLLLERRKKP
jgi:nitrate reductase gamma subunit